MIWHGLANSQTNAEAGDAAIQSGTTLETSTAELVADATTNAVIEKVFVEKMVAKEGWLQKQHHNFFHGTAPRYAKLTVDSLELYGDPADATPLVHMGLEGAWTDMVKGNHLALKLKLATAAGRRNKYDHYVLKFQGEGERDEWASAFQDCFKVGGRHLISVTK